MADKQEITWKDPPRKWGGTGAIWKSLLTPLMARPGEWALVRSTSRVTQAYSTAAALREERLQIPPGRWEFRGCLNGDGGEVYARYLGPTEDGGK